jgi:hypothetical protein
LVGYAARRCAVRRIASVESHARSQFENITSNRVKRETEGKEDRGSWTREVASPFNV